MGAQFVRTMDDYRNLSTLCGFSHGNQGGNALVLGIASYFVSSPTPLPGSMTDTAGNTYTQIMSGSLSVFTGTVEYAIYLCKQCLPSASNYINNGSISTDSSIVCSEYANATVITAVDGSGDSNTASGGATLVVPGHTGDLIFGIGYVNSGTYSFTAPCNSRVNLAWNGITQLGGDQIASGTNTNVTWSAASAGSMLAAISIKGFSSGPPAPGSSNLQLIGGPKYTFSCLPEGRKFARVSLNLATIPVIPGTFYFDELSDNIANPIGIAGYIAVEFDLAQFVRGIGLSQVRTLIAYSRPLFSGDDFGATVGSALPALLTCKQTGQSVVLGAAAIALGSQAAVEHLVTSFVFSCDNSAKVRFLAPMTTLTGFGRYNLLFCNWDQPQGIDIAGSF